MIEGKYLPGRFTMFYGYGHLWQDTFSKNRLYVAVCDEQVTYVECTFDGRIVVVTESRSQVYASEWFNLNAVIK